MKTIGFLIKMILIISILIFSLSKSRGQKFDEEVVNLTISKQVYSNLPDDKIAMDKVLKKVKWDGQDWILVGKMMDNYQSSIIIYNDETYEAGNYELENGSTISYLKKKIEPEINIESQTGRVRIEVYPNPFHEFAMINVHSKEEEGTVFNKTLRLYTMLGMHIKTIDISKQTSIRFDRGDLPAGIYYLQLLKNNKTVELIKLAIQ